MACRPEEAGNITTSAPSWDEAGAWAELGNISRIILFVTHMIGIAYGSAPTIPGVSVLTLVILVLFILYNFREIE